MTAPSITVELALNAGYSTPDADRTWTDITAYVLKSAGVKITRGRSDEVSQIDASQLSLTLNNSDGRFTAGLASGAYSPDIKIGRPIRVTSTPSGGSASIRFTGYVDAWPVAWPGVIGTFATAAITASSRRARLGLGNQRLSAVEEEILAAGPVVYYTLGGPEGSTEAADGTGQNRLPLRMAGSGAAVVFGSATGPPADGLTAAQFAGGQYLAGESDITTSPSIAWVTCFFSTVATDAPGVAYFGGCALFLNASDGLGGALLSPAGSAGVTSSPGAVNDGQTHAATYVVEAGGSADLYLDGELVDTVAAPVSIALDDQVQAGNSTVTPGGGVPFAGVLAHVAGGVDVTPLAADIAAGGLTGFDGDRSDEWIARLARWEGIPAAELDLDAGEAAIFEFAGDGVYDEGPVRAGWVRGLDPAEVPMNEARTAVRTAGLVADALGLTGVRVCFFTECGPDDPGATWSDKASIYGYADSDERPGLISLRAGLPLRRLERLAAHEVRHVWQRANGYTRDSHGRTALECDAERFARAWVGR